LVGESLAQIDAAWRLLRSGSVVPGTIDGAELGEAEALMTKYADCPMDLADATLVYLVRRESLSTIPAIDQSDFNTCRIERRKAFRIFPERRH
jgi:predicted nucleic acid-binding protein